MRTIAVFSTDFCDIDCPPELKKLWEAAPKKKYRVSDWDGGNYWTELPDRKTPSGKAYYDLEKQINEAIGVLWAAGVEVDKL